MRDLREFNYSVIPVSSLFRAIYGTINGSFQLLLSRSEANLYFFQPFPEVILDRRVHGIYLIPHLITSRSRPRSLRRQLALLDLFFAIELYFARDPNHFELISIPSVSIKFCVAKEIET